MLIKQYHSQAEEKMKRTVQRLETELGTLRTGRASITLLEGIKVESYGTTLPIQQVGNISVPEGRTIEIKPWDPTVLQAIEKAILKSDLGLTPTNDGKFIRISIPALTEERRKDLIKVVRKLAEEYRVAVRNERREAVEVVKKLAKAKEISEDELKTAEQDIEKLTQAYVRKVDDILAAKEKEILTV